MLRIILIALFSFVSIAHADGEVVTRQSGVSINWTDGSLSGIGVGRSSFDSSIARPSRKTHFMVALKDAERRLSSAIASLWARTPLYRHFGDDPRELAKRMLALHPPKETLLSDGTVHARFQVPLDNLDVIPILADQKPTAPVILTVPADYQPTLGLIWCHADETRSIPQPLVSHHSDERKLPAFAIGKSIRRIEGTFDHDFECIRLKDSSDTRDTWSASSRLPRVFVMRRLVQPSN